MSHDWIVAQCFIDNLVRIMHVTHGDAKNKNKGRRRKPSQEQDLKSMYLQSGHPFNNAWHEVSKYHVDNRQRATLVDRVKSVGPD